MKVYITGAQSQGKTTLAKYISDKYKIPLLSEVARTELAKIGLTLTQIRANVDTVTQYQWQILLSQFQVLQQAGKDFVSDRCIDVLAYAADYARPGTVAAMRRHSAWRGLVRMVKSSGVVFYITPTLQGKKDGTRVDISQRDIHRTDGAIKMLLAIEDIPYVPITSSNHQDRVNLIDYILKDGKQ